MSYGKRKLKINSHTWDHHRHGWKCVISAIKEHLHNEEGVLCEGVMEEIFRNGITLPMRWIGFSHATPYVAIDSLERHNKINFLDGLFDLPAWEKSIPSCEGIFTFSEYTARIIRNEVPVPVMSLKHPAFFPENTFDFDSYLANKTLAFMGDWLRNIASIYNINCEHKKVLVDSGFHRQYEEYSQFITRNHGSVETQERMNDKEFDIFLSKTLIFTHLYEASANNTVLDCIARNTPLLVNRLPAVVEYLGPNYPLFFDDLEEASSKIANDDLVYSTHRYLCDMDKEDLKVERFLSSVAQSGIYNFL